MGLEIERKFKVRELPSKLSCLSCEKIVQGYIIISDNGIEVRLRKYGNKYFETIKSNGNLIRKEIEIKLTQKQFVELWPLTKGKRIEKERFTYRIGVNKIEVDIYKGKLESLVIAEVEFKTISDSKKFTPPNWFGEEVTNYPEFKNKNLGS